MFKFALLAVVVSTSALAAEPLVAATTKDHKKVPIKQQQKIVQEIKEDDILLFDQEEPNIKQTMEFHSSLPTETEETKTK